MTVSRNAREYLERAGNRVMVSAPRPRLNVTDLLVNQLPDDYYRIEQPALLHYEGPEPPDRGAAKTWPNQQ